MIYFDAAATTMQKPKSVSRAMVSAMERMASAGRGDSVASFSAGEVMLRCREEAAALFAVPTPEQVVFTFNATQGLNIAIRSLAKEGSRVLISGYEHNAVTRPLAAVPGLSLRSVQTALFSQEAFLEDFDRQIEEGVDLVICTHISNVFGYVLPIAQVAARCRLRGVPLIVDASQSAGVLPLDFIGWGAAFVAMPGHKGLYGPQGTGLLLCGQEAEPLLYGGTGSLSLSQQMPAFLPDRLEAGTQNVAGIAGLLQGLYFVKSKREGEILRHEQCLRRQAAAGLRSLGGMEVFEAEDEAQQTGVLSFRVEDCSCEDLGARLACAQVALRTGLHCAPLAHQTVGTAQTGTLRLSFSAFNNRQELTRVLRLLRTMLRR